MLIFGRDRELAQWAAPRLGYKEFGPCVAIGVAHKNEIVAVAIYNNYRHPSIEITFVTSSPRWASAGAIRAIFKYPFYQIGCSRVTAITEDGNNSARKFLIRLGFKQEGILRCAFHDSDGIVYGILREEAARWM